MLFRYVKKRLLLMWFAFWRQEYLRQFAHLGDANPDPRMQQYRSDPDQQFALAVSSFQRMAGLNVTGN